MNREEWLESLRKRGWSDSDISKARFAWNAGNRAGQEECASIVATLAERPFDSEPEFSALMLAESAIRAKIK